MTYNKKIKSKITKLLSVVSCQLSVAKRRERGFLNTKIIIAISVGILILSLIGGAIWYGKYQAAKKAAEENQKLQTRIITPAKLPMSAPAPIAPFMFLTASPDLIKYDGANKAIILKAAIGGNPTSCAYSWDKNLSSVDSKEYTLTIPGSTQTHQIYTITCENEGGIVSKSAAVTISAAEPPTIDFSADKNQVEYKKSATLTWSSKGATGCELKDTSKKTLSRDLSGSKTLSSLTKSDAYIVTCSGPGGQTSNFTSIMVNAPPVTIKKATAKTATLSLTTSTQSITYDSSVTLSWSASNVVSYCMASSTPSGIWSDSKATSGSEEIKNLTESETFTLDCGGNNGSISKSVSVAVSAEPIPTISLSADPTSVSYDSPTTLTWSVADAESCLASDDWSGSKETSGSEDIENMTDNKTYTLTCLGTGGTGISKSVSVTVGAAPAPTISLTAEPSSVSYNGSSKLTWSVTDAISCSVSGAWSGSKETSGSEDIENITNSKTYTLSCMGVGGTASKSVSVTVGTAPAPTISLTAEPSSVSYNGSSKLTWSVTDATSCSASGGWFGSKATSGSEQTGNLATNKTYSLLCMGVGGIISKSVSVAVSYTYAWNEGNWGNCIVGACVRTGSQTRTITCKKSDGQTAPDSNCPSPKPINSQSCSINVGVGMTIGAQLLKAIDGDIYIPTGRNFYNTNFLDSNGQKNLKYCGSEDTTRTTGYIDYLNPSSNPDCTCITGNKILSSPTCTFNSWAHGGNNFFDCHYSCTINSSAIPECSIK